MRVISLHGLAPASNHASLDEKLRRVCVFVAHRARVFFFNSQKTSQHSITYICSILTISNGNDPNRTGHEHSSLGDGRD
jgi:hypothetical protein